jgi:hypothetical protein
MLLAYRKKAAFLNSKGLGRFKGSDFKIPNYQMIGIFSKERIS